MSISDLDDPAAPVMGEQVTIDPPKKKLRFDIKNFHFRPQYFVFLFLLLLLPAAVLIINNQTSFRNRASSTLPQTKDEFAQNEKAFVQTYWNKYYGDITDKQQFHDRLDPFLVGDWSWGGSNGGYRTLCTHAIVATVAKGPLTSDDPFVKHFADIWDSQSFLMITPAGHTPWSGPGIGSDTGSVDIFIRPISVQLCLVGGNMMKSALQATPSKISGKTLYDVVMEDTREAERRMMGWLTGNDGKADPLNYYLHLAYWGSIGDSKGEEVGGMYSALMAGARLLPKTGLGAITDAERISMYQVGKKLMDWGYSKCQGACVFRGNGTTADADIKYLVNNHDMAPNPDYTLAVPHFYGEVAAVFNQLDDELSGDIFTGGLKSAMIGMGNDLDAYLTNTFTFKGPFSFIDPNRNYHSRLTRNYEDQTYLMKPIDGVRSSIPQDSVTTMTQYVSGQTDDGSMLSSMVVKGEEIWPYECYWTKDNTYDPRFTKENYFLYCMSKPKTTVSDWLTSKNITNKEGAGWISAPLPTAVDAISQFYKPGTNELKIYLYKDNRMWHFVCAGGDCKALYTQTFDTWLSPSNILNQEAAGWVANLPPMDKLDSMSQFVEAGTNKIKSYLTRGNRVWVYACDPKCNASYTKTLDEYFKQISDVNGSWEKAGWSGEFYPQPTKLDAQFHYYLPNGTLKVFWVQGNKIWEAACSSGCSPVSATILAKYYSSSKFYQYDWPLTKETGDIELKGVASWGRDATFQNASFAFMYLMNPMYITKYQELQMEELNRGRASGTTAFPINYENGNWNYNFFKGYQQGKTVNEVWQGYLSDGGAVTGNAWMNMQASLCHSLAYLMLTSDKTYLSGVPVSTPVSTPTPTPKPTVAPPVRIRPDRQR